MKAIAQGDERLDCRVGRIDEEDNTQAEISFEDVLDAVVQGLRDEIERRKNSKEAGRTDVPD
jgi:hypothetical protein